MLKDMIKTFCSIFKVLQNIAWVWKEPYGGYNILLPYDFEIKPPLSGQEHSIEHDANEAAAKILEKQFGVMAVTSIYVN